jgi:hypothetical protein
MVRIALQFHREVLTMEALSLHVIVMHTFGQQHHQSLSNCFQKTGDAGGSAYLLLGQMPKVGRIYRPIALACSIVRYQGKLATG